MKGALLCPTLLVACGSSSHDGSGGAPAGGASGMAGTPGGASSSGQAGNASAAGGAGTAGGASGGSSGAATGGASDLALPADSITSTHLGTCAIGNQGSVTCWGVFPDFPEVLFQPPSGTFQHIRSGTFVCAQRATGELSCFQEPRASEPIESAPTGPVVSFDIGVSAMCSLSDDGSVACSYLDYPMPPGLKLKRVAVDRKYACGIRATDATIVCWGSDGSELPECDGDPELGQLRAPPGEFTDLDLEHATGCALRTDGTIACWGSGDATPDPCDAGNDYRQAMPPEGEFTQISMGTYYGCGVKVGGSVVCWGAGQAGDCATFDVCGQAAPPAGEFVQVAAGYTHTCAMRSDRSVACWGSNTGGRSTPPADFR